MQSIYIMNEISATEKMEMRNFAYGQKEKRSVEHFVLCDNYV